MLDMGFKPAVDRIVAQTPATARRCSSRRRSRARPASSPPPTPATPAATPTRRPSAQSADIEHRFVHVDSQSAKLDHLVAQLRDGERGRTLVFVRTKRGADRLVKRLRSRELEAVAMHGDKSQGQRERALARFERGDVDDPGRDRRRRPRHRRRRHHPRDQLRRPRRPRRLRAPGRPHRPRRAHRHRHQLRPRRPGRRDAPHRPRPRPRPRVRPRARRHVDRPQTAAGSQASGNASGAGRARAVAAAAAQGGRMSRATAHRAKKWTCDRCGVSRQPHRRRAGAAARYLGAARQTATSA